MARPGRQGRQGKQGRQGRQGRPGRQGARVANAVVEQLSGLVGERFFGFVVGQVLKLWAALVSAPGDGVARRLCGHSLFFALGERAGTAVFFLLPNSGSHNARLPCSMQQWEYQQWQQHQQQKQQQQKKQQR